MLQDNLLLIISLLFAASLLSMLSEKLRISYPVFMVMAGLLISLVPGIPRISLDPDTVFLIFLPPLLYASAWNTSWHDFWLRRRPIGLLAIGLVIFTAGTIAFISNRMIPGFPLSLGFLLGGIISPTDAVAATGVLQSLKAPKRVVTILEGESLVNDASGLIIFRFALLTIFTGQFTLWKAGGSFLLVAGMGILIGLVIGYIMFAVHKWLPTTANIDTVLTLISPYLMYITAEHFHFSGVLAVVSGGLMLSYCSHDVFSYSTRLQTQSVWSILVFLLNGVVFILIGLQLPDIVRGLGEYSLRDAIFYAVIISLTTILLRIIWVYPAAYIPRVLSKRIRKTETKPTWKAVFIIGWSGMRGVVSLASALAIPLSLTGGAAFPHRNLILFITFTVIFFTLVLQGLSLPVLMRWLKIEANENESEQTLTIRLRLAKAALDHIETEYADETSSVDAFHRLKARYERMVEIANKKIRQEEGTEKTPSFLPRYRKMLLELVAVQRKELAQMRRDNEFSDELIRSKEFELDLEEARFQRQSPLSKPLND